MSLSRRSIEILLDLVEIKISYMDVADRDDARDMQLLERLRAELKALERSDTVPLMPFAGPGRRPGRPRAGL
jgi:hypothetical protein